MIKTVDASTLRNHLADVVKEVAAKRDYVLLTRKARPTAVLVNLDFFEDLLALSSKGYLRSIREARKDFKAGRTFSHHDVFGNLG